MENWNGFFTYESREERRFENHNDPFQGITSLQDIFESVFYVYKNAIMLKKVSNIDEGKAFSEIIFNPRESSLTFKNENDANKVLYIQTKN